MKCRLMEGKEKDGWTGAILKKQDGPLRWNNKTEEQLELG